MKHFIALSLGLVLSACATGPGADPGAPQSRAQALAALLVETEASQPARLLAAEPEMTALEQALARPHAPDEQAGRAADPAPAPDLSGARSVLSAVHVASYRERRHAVSGWAELTERHAELAGMRARLTEADLGERGLFLRLKAGPFDTPEAAQAACDAIRASGEWCAVTDFSGEDL